MIILKEYDPTYERERVVIERALTPYFEAIEHVGSTSIPGLSANQALDPRLFH